MFISILILSFFYFGCREKSSNSRDIPVKDNLNNDSLFNSVVKEFTLPYPENFKLDSNTLIFFGSRPFDTSFLVHLKNGSKEIEGTYYEVIPTYHMDINNFSVPANKLLFFEGYSFILDTSKWQKIKSRTEGLLLDTTSFNIYNACRDCEVYGLYYSTKSNIGNAIKYHPFYKYLKEVFLDSFIQRRKPVMYKVK